ncbi:transcriptional regulator [Flavobacterium plurextorum]|uniref:transcriptional regulator n=1 Tax=Flavobacterium TaxID=237 RepID=UPI00214DC3DD|nr:MULTISPECIES: transcriptional regulator [Flavobacterium]UUW08358.1 transcriptional regulator [Flavobacterium plurextorum]
MQEEVIEIIISQLDFYLIEKVRDMRVNAVPYISQVSLSQKLDLSEGFVSKVENLKERSKYNIRLVNRIVNVFNLNSYSDLFPSEIIKNDIVRMRIKVFKNIKSQGINSEKEILKKSYQIISINPLSEKDVILWKSNKLDYLTIIK